MRRLEQGLYRAPDTATVSNGVRLVDRERQPWLQHPTLAVKRTPEVVGNIDTSLQRRLTGAMDSLYRELIKGFRDADCPTVVAEEGKAASKTDHAVMINPVLLGRLPKEAQRTLATADPDETEFDPAYDQRLAHLREYLPEHFPFLFTVGRNMFRVAGIDSSIGTDNFANMIFVDDSTGDIRRLPYQWKKVLNWMFMAKLGAFKNIIVPYTVRNGMLDINQPMLCTLEGGHPSLTPEALAFRLMVLGSAGKVPDPKELPSVVIPHSDWVESPEVKGIIAVGRYLGEKRLLSPPLQVRKFVKNPVYRAMVERLSGFTRQAEGAITVKQQKGDLWIATCTGKDKVLKTALTPGDLAAIFATHEGIQTMRVAGIKSKRPSVEAQELNRSPERLLFRNQEDYGVWVNGERKPLVRGAIHLHRGARTRSNRVFMLPDEHFPPFPCGSNLMDYVSEDAQERYMDEHNRRIRMGQTPPIAAIRVLPVHGVTIYFGWIPRPDGTFSEDPFEQTRELIDTGEIAFTYEVPQR